MKPPTRVTVALDEPTANLFEEMKDEMRISRSELIRRALRFYHDYKSTVDLGGKDTSLYVEMLHEGEHIILDVDHWLLFLKLADAIPDSDPFWENCRSVADAHAKQLSDKLFTPEMLLKRLEACNFFKLIEDSKKEYTLVLGSEVGMRFVKTLIEDLSKSMGFAMDVEEGISKIRVRVNDTKNR